ncbi:hypothetical protein E3T61_03190 [Cryobacterium lactosi]|uniref:Calcineurin-like phosphoesterase domain-containing protein n=1 Tax=Cryobacterium lactosi TaxID=1259202 RepID=A0A4R9BY29_9MICO|nr:hypothetical protein [Cryobacterium lactosi]TFD94017.1 hypothetical protein E3T61_03190 [Cryobacterium lactosi]
MFFVDGNLDRHEDLYEHPVDASGYRWFAPNIGHLPRGFRATVAGGRTLAALGGAASVDRPRVRYLETVSADDLAALGASDVDILIGHDAPQPLPALDQQLAGSWTEDALAYAADARNMFTRGFLAVKPALYLGGHFHTPIDVVAGFVAGFGDGEDRFAARVVLLDAVSGRAQSQGIRDLASLTFEVFSLDD